ncbi:aminomethyltransferase [Rhodococcus sp. Leaf225]|nr:aminomethyltransferase [Rhodococcus sp. Leaf225]KQU39825.1 aminomethyltransferase [Rhodococcus sp. Leaf258]
MTGTENAPLTLQDVPRYFGSTYVDFGTGLHLWESDGWKSESMSWKTGTYIASNLSGIPELTFSGPHAQDYLSRISINNVYNWQIGKSKHLVMPDENGLIALHALTVRDSEESFRMFGAGVPWPVYKAATLGAGVDLTARDIFIFQIAGPTSLQVLERLLGESLRTVGFLEIKKIRLPGLDADVEIEISRIGMVGTLAYELRGPLDFGPAVFDAVHNAGSEFGIKRLGWRTYVVNHTEGGYPQQACTFTSSAYVDSGFVTNPMFGPTVLGAAMTGSIDPADVRARLRTPQEVNWAWMAKFDHDFVGRSAIEAEAAAPRRKTVTLRWNKDDVVDVFASQFDPGEEYKNFEFPTTPQSPAGGHADLVTLDGKPVGVSSVAVYSYYYRHMISHCTLDLEHADVGREVIIHWGDHGQRIKLIRATVERFPYLDLPSNKSYDLSSIPSGAMSPSTQT